MIHGAPTDTTRTAVSQCRARRNSAVSLVAVGSAFVVCARHVRLSVLLCRAFVRLRVCAGVVVLRVIRKVYFLLFSSACGLDL